jgi:hypothetical protein
VIPLKGKKPVEQLQQLLLGLGVITATFKTWTAVDELRLVANTVKQGAGRSAEELGRLNLSLFQERSREHFPNLHVTTPIRPLVGEGLRLTEEHFKNYSAALKGFWEELTERLPLLFCRP